jgi:hypothetical protein
MHTTERSSSGTTEMPRSIIRAVSASASSDTVVSRVSL